MKKKLIHWIRLLFEPRHHGLFLNQPKRWFVRYPPDKHGRGGDTVPMSYATACDYANIFNGTVHRYTSKEHPHA